MSARFWSLLVWALVGAGAVFWALKLLVRPQPLPPQATVALPPDLLKIDLTRLLGGAEPTPAGLVAPVPDADSRLTLVGVVSAAAGASTNDAVAMISVDGEPPRAYRVGDLVEGDRVLQRVSQRKAHLGPAGGPPQLTLAIPEPVQALRGAPPVVRGASLAVPPPPLQVAAPVPTSALPAVPPTSRP